MSEQTQTGLSQELQDSLIDQYLLRERVYSTLPISRRFALKKIGQLFEKAGLKATMEFLFSPVKYDYSDELFGDKEVEKKEKCTMPHWSEKLSPYWNKPS